MRAWQEWAGNTIVAPPQPPPAEHNLRIALLSTLDDQPKPGVVRAAFAQFAGALVVERQLDLALALECETIACLVDGVGREVIDLQHRAERAGAKFVSLREPRHLSGLVTAADEILVMAPAILPDDTIVMRHLVKPSVLVFPADPAVSLGYERIDAEFAWSGVLLARGSIVERLTELPPDADTSSALMRIALQTGTRIHPLEKRLIEEQDWHYNATPQQLAEREARWIRGHAKLAPFTAPGTAVSERMGARLAQDILGKAGERAPWFVAGVAALVALGLAIFDLPAFALGFAALMAICATMGDTVERIGRAGQIKPLRSLMSRVLDGLLDPLLVGLVALASPEDAGWLRLFVPAVLVGLLRVGQRLADPRWRPSYGDRVLLCCLLAPAAFIGWVQPVAAVLGVAVLVSLFFTPRTGD